MREIRNQNPLFIGISTIVVALIAFQLSIAIVSAQYDLLFIIIGLFITFLVIKNNLIAILIVVFTFPITRTLYYFIPMFANSPLELVPELLSGFLFLKSIFLRHHSGDPLKLPGAQFVIPVVIISLLSWQVNNLSIDSFLIFLRMIIRFYLLFLAIINLNINKKQENIIIKSMIILFIIQIPLSAFKYYARMDDEAIFSLNGSSMTTTVSLTAIGFIIAFYLIYKSSRWYILVALGFIGFGIVGGKRAVPFLIPVVLFYSTYLFKNEVKNIFKYSLAIIPLVYIAVYFMIRMLPTLNPENKVWGSFDINYAMNFAESYTTGTIMPTSETTGGRLQTSLNVYNNIMNTGIKGVIFGFGPGYIMKSKFSKLNKSDLLKEKFKIHYGITGLNWLSLQIGYLGAFLYLSFFVLILLKLKRYYLELEDPYEKALTGGTTIFTFIIILISLIYSPVFKNDAITVIYFTISGIMISRSYKYLQ